jgi:SynChlorMet cassette radical SAM/SPASM protein ScmF
MTTEKKAQNKIPLLTSYYMYITGSCNLACQHCWIAPSVATAGDNGVCLDFRLFKTAIDEGIPLGLKQVKFTGGEPLLHPDFLSMADYATSKGIRTWMETNGTLLTSKIAAHLKNETSLDFISVSLDGAVASTNDDFRNVKGSFDQAMGGIESLVRVGYMPQIIMSLSKWNFGEIEAMINIALSSGCGSLKFNLIQPSGRGEKMAKNEKLLSIHDLIDLGQWIESDLQQKYSIPLFFSWPIAFHSIRRMKNDFGANCNVLNILGILSSGEIALCGIGTQERDLIYGKLGKDKISDIWKENLRIKEIRKTIPADLEGVCGKCLFKSRCMGSCVAQNYHATRRLTSPFWFCRDAYQENKFPLNKIIDK